MPFVCNQLKPVIKSNSLFLIIDAKTADNEGVMKGGVRPIYELAFMLGKDKIENLCDIELIKLLTLKKK